MDDARRNYPTLKKKFNERKTNLKMKRMEVVLKKQNDLKEKKMKADMKKVEAVNELVSLGLHAWLSNDEAQDYFCSINNEKMRSFWHS